MLFLAQGRLLTSRLDNKSQLLTSTGMADQVSSEATPPEAITTPSNVSEVELDQQALLLKLEQQNRSVS